MNLDNYPEREEGSIVLSEGDKKSDGPQPYQAKEKKASKPNFSMRKAHVDSADLKIGNVSSKTSPNKESTEVKLNAEMLSKLETHEVRPFELSIPSASYANDIEESDKGSEQDEEDELLYLERKYLSKEFLYNNNEPQVSSQTSQANYLRFEALVNSMLNDASISYKWYFYIQLYINKITTQLRPNPNRPNEVIDYNDYVNIRCINWKNHLK